MKKNLLYLLAAGLSGTAFLHAADTVKLDQPDLERGAPIMKALGGQWHQPSGIRQTYSPVRHEPPGR